MEKIKEKVLNYLREIKRKVKIREIEQNIENSDPSEIQEVINELEQKGLIVKCKKGKYLLTEYSQYISGIIQGNERGYAFLRPINKELEDMFIDENSLNGALDGDTVLVSESSIRTGNKKEAIVYKIINMANQTIIGTVKKTSRGFIVIPDNKRIPCSVIITGGKLQEVKVNQKVMVEITKRKGNIESGKLEGEIIDIIGDKDEKGVDILSIAKTYGLEQDFPQEVMKECEKIKDYVEPDSIKNRVDLRNIKMVTIDGEDAKDLDDAVSIDILENGNYKLGVHIADVSEYVKEGSHLDKEAVKRGTSVYLIDRVIPMLPKKLSNGICSLNPHVDRLAFSVFMEIDKNGGVVSHDIFESVININERMTYTNVYKILVEDDAKLKERYKDLLDDFYKMRELAKILSRKRARRGAIDFRFGESKITLDENGKPIDVCEYKITEANKIIEEFMLVCNETVAEHFYWLNIPFVYRIHQEPDMEKIVTLSQFVKNLGYKLNITQNKVHPKALQQVLEDICGKKEERIISTVMLRSMQKAIYTTKNKGHFGLAAKYYSHFTSPIRRYPDLIIHRIMKEVLRNEFTDEAKKYYEENLEEIAKKCSDNERIAQDAERDVEDIKKCEYMHQYEGCTFNGIVSSITAFGMFVELDNTIEGLVKLSAMDDYYNFDETNYTLTGERKGKTYRIGDEVKIVVARADKETRQIDFMLSNNNGLEKPVVKRHIFKSRKEIENRRRKKELKKVLRRGKAKRNKRRDSNKRRKH